MTEQPASSDLPRYAPSPWHYGAGVWLVASKQVASNFIDHRLSLTAAGVAFFGFLSLFPAIAAFVIIYGLIADPGELRAHVQSLASVLPGQVVSVFSDRLENVVSSGNTSGLSTGAVISIAITFWSGSRGVAALVDMIGVAYRQVDTRSYLRSSILSLILTVGMLLMLLVTLTLVAVVPVILEYIPLPPLAADLLALTRWPIVLTLFCSSLCILYKLAPDRDDARFVWLLPGSLLATVLWGIMSVGFSYYVENFGSYDATFGALSAIIVLLLWLYYSVLIVALGAELNAELELTTKVDSTTGPSRPRGKRGAYVADNVKDLPVP